MRTTLRRAQGLATGFMAMLLALGLLPATASADGGWLMTSFETRGVDARDADTFALLLQSEIASRNGAAFQSVRDVCGDVPCAQGVASSRGAGVVIYGGLSRLGSKIIVTATVVDAPAGEVVNSLRMTVDRVEDLEAVAARMADAIVRGESTDDTAQLGAITHKEQAPPLRRHGDSGMALGLGGVVPFGDSYAEGGFGLKFDLSFWYEALHFAIEPRIGVRFSAEDEDEGRYVMVPMDVGAYWIASLGDIAPFVGGGGGLRYIWEDRRNTSTVDTVGSVLVETNDHAFPQDWEDDAWAFGMFARVGVLFFRTYDVRMTASVEYDISFAKLNEGRDHNGVRIQRDFPQSFTFTLGVIF